MTALQHFNLADLIAKYGLTDFVEAGVGDGDGLAYASTFPFETLTSMDIMPERVDYAVGLFSQDDRVLTLNMEAVAGLSGVCQHTPGPILLWLDAYLPARFGYTGQADKYNTPLLEQLRLIRATRVEGRDVIIIGELRLYEDGPFEGGQMKDRRSFGTTGTFAEGLFGATHDIQRDYTGTGFMILTPKQIEDVKGVEESTDALSDGKDAAPGKSGGKGVSVVGKEVKK